LESTKSIEIKLGTNIDLLMKGSTDDKNRNPILRLN